MSNDSVTYRLPIKVSAYVEVTDANPPKVIIDKYDWEYARWPRVGGDAYGDDVVQVQVGDSRSFDGDADVVQAIRSRVEGIVNHETSEWVVSRRVERDVLGIHDNVNG